MDTFDSSSLMIYFTAGCSILFLLTQVASRIAQLTPGKKDDEITSKIESAVKSVIDFLAGNHGEPGDTSLRKPSDGE